jgi:hypothetical protein
MAGERVDGGDQPLNGGSPASTQLFEIVVNGKRERFDLTLPEHQEELKRRAQMGTNYAQKAEALSQKEIELQRAYRPYQEFDAHLQKDADLQALVTARLRGDPLPLERFGARPARPKGAGDEETDDDDIQATVAQVETRLRRDTDAKLDRVTSVLDRLTQSIDQRDRRDQERTDEDRIRNHKVFKGFVRDDHIALARDAQRQRGGGLYENFILLFEDKIPAIIESRVHESIPPDLRRTMLTHETAPLVIDGVRLTEEKLAELRRDPDQYQRYKKAIRAHKRAVTGKLEYPR